MDTPLAFDDDGAQLITIIDAAGLYPPDRAAAASRATASDQGSGPCKIDD